MNNYQKTRFAKSIVEKMFGNVKRKNICLFGFAFKKDTGDIRFVVGSPRFGSFPSSVDILGHQ
jgi:UDP-glucose 6-dehydrogenase